MPKTRREAGKSNWNNRKKRSVITENQTKRVDENRQTLKKVIAKLTVDEAVKEGGKG